MADDLAASIAAVKVEVGVVIAEVAVETPVVVVASVAAV